MSDGVVNKDNYRSVGPCLHSPMEKGWLCLECKQSFKASFKVKVFCGNINGTLPPSNPGKLIKISDTSAMK